MRKFPFPAAILTVGLSLGLVACGSPEEPVDEVAIDDPMAAETMAEPMLAVAMLMTADGQQVGTASATAQGDRVMIAIEGINMPAGEHGVHVHMTGLCEGPDFTSAGGHWNPQDMAHGLEDPQGQHAGDMPNLDVGEDGNGTLEYTLAGGATLAGLMDADVSAFVIHSGADDQVTDPSGDSGERIACGVFQASDQAT